MANTVKALWFEQIANAVIQANLLELRRLFGSLPKKHILQYLNECWMPKGSKHEGKTILHLCNISDIDVSKYVLTFGAHPNVFDLRDNTPLHHACANNRKAFLRILLKYGADSTITNIDNKLCWQMVELTKHERLSIVEQCRHKGGNEVAQEMEAAVRDRKQQQMKKLFDTLKHRFSFWPDFHAIVFPIATAAKKNKNSQNKNTNIDNDKQDALTTNNSGDQNGNLDKDDNMSMSTNQVNQGNNNNNNSSAEREQKEQDEIEKLATKLDGDSSIQHILESLFQSVSTLMPAVIQEMQDTTAQQAPHTETETENQENNNHNNGNGNAQVQEEEEEEETTEMQQMKENEMREIIRNHIEEWVHQFRQCGIETLEQLTLPSFEACMHA